MVLFEDAIQRVTKQEPVAPEDVIIDRTAFEKCGACGGLMRGEPNFCPFCGREVYRGV